MPARLNIGFAVGGNSLLAATGRYGILTPSATLATNAATIARYRTGWYTATIPSDCTAAIGTDSGTVGLTVTVGGVQTNLSINLANGSVPGGSDGKKGGWDPAVTGPTYIPSSGPNAGVQQTAAIVQRYFHRQFEPTQGNYSWTRMDADLAQCRALGVWWFPMFIQKTFDNTNSIPDFLAPYTDAVTGGGTMERRWDLVNVAPVQRAALAAIGARYDKVPNFGGVCTQETAAGGATNYTIDNFLSALKLEADAIHAASPNSRHLAYQNFFPATPGGDQSSPYSDRYVDLYAAYIQRYFSILAGPDLVVSGGVVSRCYNRYHAYRNGGTITRTSPNSGVLPTVTFFGKGPTALALQNDEFSFTGHGAVQAPTAIQAAFDYGRGGSGSVLAIETCVIDHHTKPGNPNGQMWKPAVTTMMAGTPAPFSGIWTP